MRLRTAHKNKRKQPEKEFNRWLERRVAVGEAVYPHAKPKGYKMIYRDGIWLTYHDPCLLFKHLM